MQSLSSVPVTYAHPHARGVGACSEGKPRRRRPLRYYAALPRDLLLHFASINGRAALTLRHEPDTTTKVSFLDAYIHSSTTPITPRDNNPTMNYTTDLDNTDPSTQMPSSGDGQEHIQPVKSDSAKQPEPSAGDHTRLDIEDETLPAIQIPPSEADRAGIEHVDTTYPKVSLPGAFPEADSEDLSQ